MRGVPESATGKEKKMDTHTTRNELHEAVTPPLTIYVRNFALLLHEVFYVDKHAHSAAVLLSASVEVLVEHWPEPNRITSMYAGYSRRSCTCIDGAWLVHEEASSLPPFIRMKQHNSPNLPGGLRRRRIGRGHALPCRGNPAG